MKALFPPGLVAGTLALLALPLLRAQPMEPSEPGRIGLAVSANAGASGKGGLRANGVTYNDVDLAHANVSVRQQFPLAQGQFVSLGLEYGSVGIGTRPAAPAPLPDKLESLGASLRYFRLINPAWSVSASLGAGSYVADTGLLSDGWGCRAGALAFHNVSPKLSLLFGAAYNSLSQDLRFMPVFGATWRPAEKWTVSLGFPRTAVTYKLNPELSFSLSASGNAGTYRVEKDPLPGAAPRPLADSNLEFREIRLGAGADWTVNKTFRLSATAGRSLHREFKYNDRDYRLKSHGTVPFFSLALATSL